MVRRRPGEAYKPESLAPTVKSDSSEKTNLEEPPVRFFNPYGLLQTSARQSTTLSRKKNLLPFALTMFPNSEKCFFQQGNAPCHTARPVKVWMEYHQIRALSWPAQFRDLTPIKKPLKCDQEEDGWSQAMKRSRAA